MTRQRFSRRWLFAWITLLAAVVAACVLLVRNLGMPWLGLFGPLVGFVGSVPTWIGRVFQEAAPGVAIPEARQAAIGGAEANARSALEVNATGSNAANSPPASADAPLPSSGTGMPSAMPEVRSRRDPGSLEFSDLVYALGRALGSQASVYQVCELAGLSRGDLEDGFVNAPTRWYAALKLAVESGLEEALSREALRASPNRKLRTAVTAYLR
jgi:hypothetical protein